MVCAFPYPLLTTYAWHFLLEHSLLSIWHSLPITIIHRYQRITCSLMPFLSQMISSSYLYRLTRDTDIAWPSTRWGWHLTRCIIQQLHAIRKDERWYENRSIATTRIDSNHWIKSQKILQCLIYSFINQLRICPHKNCRRETDSYKGSQCENGKRSRR